MTLPARQINTAIPVKVSVRVPPNADARKNERVVEEFERYLEPSEVTLDKQVSALDLSIRQCGRVDKAWLSRLYARNQVGPDGSVPAGMTVILPPCPFWQLGGFATIDRGETVSGELLRTIGQAGDDMLERVATLNGLSMHQLARVRSGTSLKLPFVTAAVSYSVRREYIDNIDDVIEALASFSGSHARRDAMLTLVGANPPDCDGVKFDSVPFDADRLAALLERHAKVRAPRKATVAVIDTGIDEAEARLFLARATTRA